MAAEDENGTGFAGKVFGRLVGGVVSPVVENVDVDSVVEQIDLDDALDRIDVNRVVERIDVDKVVERIDVDSVVERIDVDKVVEHVDVERVVERIDVAGVVARVDVDKVVERVDVERVVERIDVDKVVERVDVNALLAGLDPDRLLDRVDVNSILDRVDANRLLDRIDPDRLLDRVDVNAVLDRVDPDRLLDRVDADAFLERVDVNALVQRTELGAIIARSTSGVFSELLDAVRTRVMLVDQVVQGAVGRLVGRPGRTIPGSPDGALEADDQSSSAPLSYEDRAVLLQGRYAGSVSRFAAFLIDQVIIGVLFAVITYLIASALRIVVGVEFDPDSAGPAVAVAYGLWFFVYVAGSLAASGQTFGKAIAGVRVVDADGSRLRGKRAAVRTIMFPLSFILFGIGLLMGLVRADRRELHDLIAGTAVIYSWDAETTRLRAEAMQAEPAT